jgi:hypothetical protein
MTVFAAFLLFFIVSAFCIYFWRKAVGAFSRFVVLLHIIFLIFSVFEFNEYFRVHVGSTVIRWTTGALIRQLYVVRAN